jgi:fructokinase
MSQPLITVIGEALVDLVPDGAPGSYQAHAGGSPFNVAVALARLGNRTALMARLGDHGFAQILRDRAAAEGIDLGAAARAAEPATLAVVSLGGPGQASYEFYSEGTADWQWTIAELRERPSDSEILHFGSIASWTPPGSKRIDQLVREARAQKAVLVSYDPNIRPAVLASPSRGRTLVERSVRSSHVVKASREDLEWLYPSRSLDEVCAQWNELGAALVVITDGARGAIASREAARPLRQPGREIQVVDTIGAGDSFTGGLLSGLVQRGLHTPERLAAIPESALLEVLGEAVLVSSITCQRAGADPPRLAHPGARSGPLALADFSFPAP